MSRDEISQRDLNAHVNVILRRVDRLNAERIITAIQAAFPKPVEPGEEPEPVRMEDAVAAISFVLATIIMSAPERQRPFMPGIIGALIDQNMRNARLVEAAQKAAAGVTTEAAKA